ncbi:MAG: PD-(D/E)XK nuclease family protein, partial [Oscillospiraceae bacterium]|nr:PD-(D/E)XK nuclease family protein [Oscillospiraceae bacterium]
YLFTLKENGQLFGEELVPAGVLYMPSKRVSLLEGRELSMAELRQELYKELRQNGLLLAEGEVLTAMEKDGAGLFVPYKLSKKGIDSRVSSLATLEEFGILERHIRRLLVKMGESLHRGDVAVSPLSGTSEACKYCDYMDVCGFPEDASVPQIPKMKPDEAISHMRGKNTQIPTQADS